MVGHAIGLKDCNVGLRCIGAAITAAGVWVDVDTAIRVSTTDLGSQRVGVMGAGDLVDDQQAIANANADHCTHVADVEVNANADWFAVSIRQVRLYVLGAVEAVINLPGGEVDELTV